MTWSADGDKHDRRCIMVAIAVGGAVTFAGYPTLGIKVATITTVWGLLFSPDLDLADTGRHQGGGCKAWHRWKRAGLGWVWKPYGHAFKHRSKFSHSLIPGTLLRLLYVCLPGLVGYLYFSDFDPRGLFNPSIEQVRQFRELSSQAFLICSCCFLADTVHLITDHIPLKEWSQ